MMQRLQHILFDVVVQRVLDVRHLPQRLAELNQRLRCNGQMGHTQEVEEELLHCIDLALQPSLHSPKMLSSPNFLPNISMQSARRPSGCGYVLLLACPDSFEIPFTAAILARAVGLGCRYSFVFVCNSSTSSTVTSVFYLAGKFKVFLTLNE